MLTNENDRFFAGSLPGQQPAGTMLSAQEHLRIENRNRAYGQDRDMTNHNRDRQHVSAARQPIEANFLNPVNYYSDGQEISIGMNSQTEPNPNTGNPEPSRRNEEEPNRRDVDPVIPEVPLRKEKREEQTPKANPGDPENLDGKNDPDRRDDR